MSRFDDSEIIQAIDQNRIPQAQAMIGFRQMKAMEIQAQEAMKMALPPPLPPPAYSQIDGRIIDYPHDVQASDHTAKHGKRQ